MNRLSIYLTIFYLAFGVTAVKADDTDAQVTIDKNVIYRTVNGRQLQLEVVRPIQPASDRLPAVLYIHGGSWHHGNYCQGLPLLKPLVATGKYIAFSVEYRFAQHKPFPAQIHDCKAAVRFIRANAEKFGVDPNRIGVFGHSAGGHLAALLGTSSGVKELEGKGENLDQSSEVQCVINNYGPGDIVALLESNKTIPYIINATRKLIDGPLKEKRDVAIQASPVTYADKNDPPMLIFQGDIDRIVPFEHSAALHAAIQKAGGRSDLIVVKGHGHGFPFEKAPLADELNRRTKLFFDKHLYHEAIEVPTTPTLYKKQ